MKVKSISISKITAILGFILLLVSIIIPYTSLEFLLGKGLRPLGLVSVFINPILGVIGGVFSLINKEWIYLLFNIIILFSFL